MELHVLERHPFFVPLVEVRKAAQNRSVLQGGITLCAQTLAVGFSSWKANSTHSRVLRYELDAAPNGGPQVHRQL